jgi:hypothetical protein
VFQIRDYATTARLLGTRPCSISKNIVVAMSLGMRNDRLSAITSFILPKLHSDSSYTKKVD